MKNPFVKIAAAGLLMLAPAIAQAAEGYSTANVNMRAGPSTRYPAVAVIPAGSSVEIRGCLSDVNWCDVEFYGGRGWVSGQYVQALYQQRRVYVGPQYYRPLGIPMIRFSVDNYWDRYYRNRDFYRERDRWSRGPDYYYRDRDNRDRDRDNRDRDRNWRERDRDRDGRDRDRDRDGRDRDRDWRDDNQRGDRQRGDLQRGDLQRGDRQGDDRRGDDRRPDRRDFDCRPGDPSCDE
ncbi:SH3 domain-containing protein [Rhizobium leguminosarum]|uniref:SH3 domain-containing protein n=1 Tax=Rhizobium leguminosarum TaxID=384 RepID=A0AAJ1A9H4_RHILE|nr:SH3 domain-containing protein [Rhizobium leguminosarum]MBY5534786.1 SH3 domain-containing protein [Rhizobium leguminosarum]MBY5596256.1 SH3 domain-containing protein [Rhizobium leguminosarum]MBY5617126.1 SH3 domain-containing protein [Rhizobium leguminosarum]MBY5629551.1 SH3 domain-containing protein [Rhizobium leguminosarum]MBY5730335.1 SH3 domain-containing protein [Rhizobium leguminosarum]